MATNPRVETLDVSALHRNPSDSAASSTLRRFLIASLVVYCALGAILVITGGPRLISNTWENTAMEAPDIFAAIRSARTGQLYFSYNESPYIVQSYGPLYYAMNAAIAKVSGLDVRQMVLHSRVICYVCYLLCGLFVFAISRKVGYSRSLSSLAAFMMLGHPDFALWSVTVRPDIFFILAMLVSLYFALRAISEGWFLVAVSGFFAAMAFLIKQPGVACAAAIFGVWAWRKEYKKATTFAIGSALPLLIVFAVVLLREKSFVEQFTVAGKFCWSLSDGARFFAQHFFFNYDGLARIIPLLIGILGLVGTSKQEGRQMIAWFGVANWVMLLSGLPQRGAVPNYFLPGWASCALLLPAAVESWRQHARQTVYMAIAAVILLWTSNVAYLSYRYGHRWSQAPKNMSYAALAPYRIISDVPILSLYGHPDLVDTFAVHSLELNGYWSSAPVVENIRNEKYDLVLMLHANFTRIVMHYRGVSDYAPSVVAALNDRYVVLCSTFDSMILKPRDRQIALKPEYFEEVLNARCDAGLTDTAPRLFVSPDAR